jgi:hypothetical protein
MAYGEFGIQGERKVLVGPFSTAGTVFKRGTNNDTCL